MCKDTIIPNWTKWLAGLALLAIALAAGTLGLVLNVSHGLEAGLAAGIAFGLADGAKVLIPLTAGIIGWSRQMKITAAACVAVSLWSAVNVYLDGAGSAFLAKQQGAEAYASQAKAITELESEVTHLTVLAATEAKNKGCGKNCKAVNDQAAVARQQLADARQARAHTKPVEVSGLAGLIAMASGASADGIARGIGAVKAALFLLLIEALVWLGMPAMTLLKDVANREIAAEPVASLVEEPATPMQIIAKAAAMPAKAGTKAYYLQRLQKEHPALAVKIASGEMSVYAASIAAGLRKAPAKASKWTKADAYLDTANAS
jgi:hypothetical protein